jgi:hypothetical protein
MLRYGQGMKRPGDIRNRIARAIAIAGLAVLCAMAFWQPMPAAAQTGPVAARAQDDNPFSALVGERRNRNARRASRATIERYVLASDDRAFLFEDLGGEARVKFLCGASDPRLECRLDPEGPSSEIYLLTATRAPRGDVIYKNTQGDTFLRIASYGGATVYWPGETQGLGASRSFGDNHTLTLMLAGVDTARRRAQSATAVISATVGEPVIFDAGPLPNEAMDASVLADAIMTAAKGVYSVAEDPTGARVFASRIDKVSFVRSQVPGVELTGRILEIRYDPTQDVLGRPSSAAVARYLEESL